MNNLKYNNVLKNKYQLFGKKDASFMVRGITENNNVRTRIYGKENIPMISTNFKLSYTIGSVESMSVNRQAICLTFSNSSKNFIIVNTELSYNDGANLGLSDRQKEFMSLIREFELHKKYKEGYNIIFCGSLNFKLNPFKMLNQEFRFEIEQKF